MRSPSRVSGHSPRGVNCADRDRGLFRAAAGCPACLTATIGTSFDMVGAGVRSSLTMRPIGRSGQQARLLRAGGYLGPVGQYGLFGCSSHCCDAGRPARREVRLRLSRAVQDE
jgi:hypothetical protein